MRAETRTEAVRHWRRRQGAAIRFVVARARRSSTRARRSLADVVAAAWNARAEIALALALISGWMLVTYALADVVRPRIVWPLSVGLLLLSASGWQLIAKIATRGCYVLHVAAKRARDDR